MYLQSSMCDEILKTKVKLCMASVLLRSKYKNKILLKLMQYIKK